MKTEILIKIEILDLIQKSFEGNAVQTPLGHDKGCLKRDDIVNSPNSRFFRQFL